jgi:Flp pilus assembly pilin Flp
MAKQTTKVVLQSMIALASAALGLVAALAWNDAIKETIKQFLGSDDSLASKYTYAVLATILAVVVVVVLTRIAAKIGGDAAISREAEG